MKYYPIFLDVKDKACLVVGGGKVGTRKAKGLARAGARVTVVSPECDPALETSGDIRFEKRGFAEGDLDGVHLVFAATDNQSLNAKIRQAARTKGVLCNIADGRDKGDFILPSVVARGDLLIAVSTCGASPALAKRLRKELAAEFGPEYGVMLSLMANIRSRMLAEGHDPEGHKKVFTELVGAGLVEMIARGETVRINEVLGDVVGPKFVFEELANTSPDRATEQESMIR
ncbi:MAG: bifunctional precorrin-2 dehydrogenase/sirohydrochlorin ferrochelatase [Desulfobacterales bacterium]|nr:bifunctional precorrin-2 dehydrogenase/sirohydrochlorin ferrochelatase [Desulfobacterales bacterium]